MLAWLSSERSEKCFSGTIAFFSKPSVSLPSFFRAVHRSNKLASARSVYALRTNGSLGSRFTRRFSSSAFVHLWCGKATAPDGPHMSAPRSNSVLKHSRTCWSRFSIGNWKRSMKDETRVGSASMRGSVADIQMVLYIGVIMVWIIAQDSGLASGVSGNWSLPIGGSSTTRRERFGSSCRSNQAQLLTSHIRKMRGMRFRLWRLRRRFFSASRFFFRSKFILTTMYRRLSTAVIASVHSVFGMST
mmetsp:Transcript_93681/g.270681  ORF Transcript_93681/g.270681 Transcript_93681/m.270681 type:complete len:245 (+) Transcript_93681:954-1688(+)